MQVQHTVFVPAPRDAAEVFDFLAAFDNAARWDPTVRSASRVPGTGPGVGTAFDLVVAFGRSTVPMRYDITSYARPTRLGLRGFSRFSEAVDDIRVTATDDGVRIVWTLTVRFRGVLRLVSPLAAWLARPALDRLGRDAMMGLASALGGRLLTA